ncbi:hypothetical protein [Aureliella helgolandensis]|uniref:Cna protein B-type domain protein n=1 Tax=Aureliella helgolandensis TaxID=2527968 RepID=A0A518G1K2_9BACT|nr:hypothetical protein [Aureliella helgolandensis]QDV22473.1 hypothetical protein Q31a_07580 [Aureliella helgolandensis]
MKKFIAAMLVCCGLAPFAVAQEVVQTASSTVAPGVYHSGWASLDAAGNVQGQVVTVGAGGITTPQAGSVVELRDGEALVASATADSNGNFILSKVAPGVYGLTAAGPNTFAAHAVQVLSHPQGAADQGMAVYATHLNRAEVDGILRSLFVPGPIAESTYGPLQEPVGPVVQSQRVAMNGGVVDCYLSFSHGNGTPEAHTVKILQDGVVTETAAVDSTGRFTFHPQSAGAYDLVVGGIGFGSIGVEVVDETAGNQLTSNDKSSRFVAAKMNNAVVQQSLMVPVIAPSTPANQPPMIVEEFAGPPALGGGFPAGGGFSGGGGFGGGGGGGGFGGAGGLLGIAGLAVGIAALADDDDGFTPPVATGIVTP